jgi:hypothetical protein
MSDDRYIVVVVVVDSRLLVAIGIFGLDLFFRGPLLALFEPLALHAYVTLNGILQFFFAFRLIMSVYLLHFVHLWV